MKTVPTLTPTQTTAEFAYLIGERLGELCGKRKPTPEEREQARLEAKETIKRMNQQADE